jgi:hypothetical protein
MVKLIFYGGVNEIGGNKILLEDKGTKIFLDFGQSFTFGSEFFASWLQPRGINGLGDYFEFNPLPKISGLYSKEMLASKEGVDVLSVSSSFRSSFCLGRRGRFFCILGSRKVQFPSGFSFLFCRLCLS